MFREGDRARDILLLVDGLVVLTTSPNQTLGIRVPGQVIEPCAHDLSIPYRCSAGTITEVRMYRLSTAEIEKRKWEDPAVAIFFERIMSMDLWQAATYIRELKTVEPSKRFERFLRFIGTATDSSRNRLG